MGASDSGAPLLGPSSPGDIRVRLLHEAHLRSVDGMASALGRLGWRELSAGAGHDELLAEYDSQLSCRLSGSPPPASPASLLRFFFDLYKLEGGPELPFCDIVVSFLDETPGQVAQFYREFAGDSFCEVESFLQALLSADQAVLVFPGRFEREYRNGRKVVVNAHASQQRSLNGLCVDVDRPAGVDMAVDPAVVAFLLESLPSPLLPSYICLTGNGFHLWWMFDAGIQLFTERSPRRAHFKALLDGICAYLAELLSGLPCEVDSGTRTISHGFRAPGSVTKFGDRVRCFALPSRPDARICPRALSCALSSFAGAVYPPALVLAEDSVRHIGRTELAGLSAARDERIERRRGRGAEPATERQLEAIASFERAGALSPADLAGAESLSVGSAGKLIRRAVSLMEEDYCGHAPSRPSWRTRPHVLIAGRTGGVYRTVYDKITLVVPGRRYNALFMLAGVAFMMVRPSIPLDALRVDFLALLDTPWACVPGRGPLTKKDVENALKGFCAANWQSKQSIIRVLGFDPFKPGNRHEMPHLSRAENLAHNARPAYAEKSRESKLALISGFLRRSPAGTMSGCARETGISRPTVAKYWAEACAMASVEDVRTGNPKPF